MMPLMMQMFAATLLCLWAVVSAHAQASRTPPSWDKWAVGCSNAGVCYASTFVRGQSTWVDVRIVRDWPADAEPLLRITTNTALSDDGAIRLFADNISQDTLPVSQLREIQAAIVAPAGFRPIGGEGFWYPTGPATRTLLESIRSASELVIELPVEPEPVRITVPLKGLHLALTWVDNRQTRNGTISAIAAPGSEPSKNAPHANPLVSPESLPAPVTAAWDANRFCSDIDPAIFASLDAISAPLDEASALYLLPCGAPSAYNTPYVAVLAPAEGKARQIHLARMSEKGPVAVDLIYNAKWNPGRQELEGYFKGSGLGECGTWNRWSWTGSAFVLMEEATRQTCDEAEAPLNEWPTSWPLPASNH